MLPDIPPIISDIRGFQAVRVMKNLRTVLMHARYTAAYCRGRALWGTRLPPHPASTGTYCALLRTAFQIFTWRAHAPYFLLSLAKSTTSGAQFTSKAKPPCIWYAQGLLAHFDLEKV